jgi:predicted transcriptional regulator
MRLHEYILCLEDGKQLTMLRRHLMVSFNMTPEAYRQRWGLPRDYPMTAPNYVNAGLQ